MTAVGRAWEDVAWSVRVIESHLGLASVDLAAQTAAQVHSRLVKSGDESQKDSRKKDHVSPCRMCHLLRLEADAMDAYSAS
jgi:hypothetical protein